MRVLDSFRLNLLFSTESANPDLMAGTRWVEEGKENCLEYDSQNLGTANQSHCSSW